ncbi:MAG TPA: beta-ketoacyl-[acyl-carrier-protein] synthase family protein [Caulobacteraceae bacterium]|jgi:nodulation protein E|nr:beta-ketoacyl-[acyl-carrier-protein] synthase family protein [Caulobacteraceae bacterium]
MPERIVVTGLGAVSALGLTADENWIAARDGDGGIKVHDFDTGEHGSGVRSNPAALVRGDPVPVLEAAFGRRIAGSLDPFALYALKAAHEALEQAGLLGAPLGPRAAAVMGSGIGGLQTLEKGYERLFGMKAQKVHPLTVPRVMVSAPVSAIAMEFGINGPVFSTSSACSSAAHAIAQGAALLAGGLADVAVVGGSEAMASPGGMRSWEGLQAMTESTCRPFSSGRDGMAIGEGGAALVLETERHAELRGATPLAWYVGAGMTSDAFHWTQPSLEGAMSAMRQACEAGGFLAGEELLISAHGTGTPLNDKNEAAAIRELFGWAAPRHPVIATKSAHGHVIGASPAVQTVIALKGLQAGLAPPILGYLGADEECAGIDLVLGEARPIQAKSLLVNAFAFGGLNCCLAFRTP